MKLRTRVIAIAVLIHNVALQLRTTPYSACLVSGLLAIQSIPPVVGFTFTVALSGFVYGFPGGVFPAISGAMMGSSLAFWILRRYSVSRWIRLSPSKQATFQALEEAIAQGGLRIMILLRLCPLPWPLVNLLFSVGKDTQWSHFLIATCFGMVRIVLEVWIGSQLATLADPELPPSAYRVALSMMGCGILLLISVSVWLYRLTMARANAMTAKKTSDLQNEKELLSSDPMADSGASTSTTHTTTHTPRTAYRMGSSSQENRAQFQAYIRHEFRTNKLRVSDFATIEYLLRRGRRQLETYRAPSIQAVHF
ncbi:hypothetical protein BDF14DRAFT_1879028 [Spinellus fusiger]|nr:hypothetical protein BDF14DRAFT_1879028 [Spinellus fusiger]